MKILRWCNTSSKQTADTSGCTRVKSTTQTHAAICMWGTHINTCRSMRRSLTHTINTMWKKHQLRAGEYRLHRPSFNFPFLPTLDIWNWWCVSDLAQSITSCASPMAIFITPPAAMGTVGTGASYFTAWHKGHLFTLLGSLALACEPSPGPSKKGTTVWHSLDPEVVGRQLGVINLQHDAGVLQRLLSHLSGGGEHTQWEANEWISVTKDLDFA